MKPVEIYELGFIYRYCVIFLAIVAVIEIGFPYACTFKAAFITVNMFACSLLKIFRIKFI